MIFRILLGVYIALGSERGDLHHHHHQQKSRLYILSLRMEYTIQSIKQNIVRFFCAAIFSLKLVLLMRLSRAVCCMSGGRSEPFQQIGNSQAFFGVPWRTRRTQM